MSGEGSDIADRLNRDIDSVIAKFWPSAITVREKGVQVALLTPKIKEGKKGAGRKPTSSFKVTLSGSNRGQWYRFSRDVGGYGLALLHYGHTDRVPVSKDDYREAFRYAKEFLGITQERQETPEDKAAREERRAQDQAKRDAEAKQAAEDKAKRDAARTLSAADVWKGTTPLLGTHGEAYLIARGIPPISEWPWNPDETLRFHPALDFELDRDVGLYPAIVGRVQDAFGIGSAVWQVYLDREKPDKADLQPSSKVGRGPAKGGAVRIGGVGKHIGVAEGIESALGAWALEDYRRPVWATLSTSGMSSFEPPMEVERITVIPDGDKALMSQTGKVLEPPGSHAAHELQSRMKSIGLRCSISDMAILGDALDLLMERRKHEKQNRAAP